MSKNKVLSENTIRRFQKLANIGTLSENFMQEMHPAGYPAAQEAPAQEEMGAQLPEQMDEEEVEVGVDAAGGGDKQAKVRELLDLIAEISGIEMDVSEEGEAGEEEVGGAGDMMGADGALEAGEEEDEEEDGEEDEEGGEGEEDEGMNEAEEQEVGESASVSDDAMVESIVRRVTARLLEEAKKGKKMTAKQKMALKKAQAKKGGKKEDKKAARPVEEATAATGGGPLLKKGGNKHDVWAGTPDMKLAKGDKGGAGGHKLSPLKGTKKNAV